MAKTRKSCRDIIDVLPVPLWHYGGITIFLFFLQGHEPSIVSSRGMVTRVEPVTFVRRAGHHQHEIRTRTTKIMCRIAYHSLRMFKPAQGSKYARFRRHCLLNHGLTAPLGKPMAKSGARASRGPAHERPCGSMRGLLIGRPKGPTLDLLNLLIPWTRDRRDCIRIRCGTYAESA